MRIKIVKIPLAEEVYATAADEARRAGFTCVGTKVRHDVETMYRRIAERRRSRKEQVA